MKRDWNLIRHILNEAESCEAGFPLVLVNPLVIERGSGYIGPHCQLNTDSWKFEEVCEHVLLLGDKNFAFVRNLGTTNGGLLGVALDRLTMEGHDFSEAARDDTRWKKAMKKVDEKGGTVTIGVLTQILSALMKQSFGLQ